MLKAHGMERIMTMSDSVWARHTNPWSGWSRVTILPLLVIAVWSRDWIDWWALLPIGAVLIWTWVNPRLFPPPASTDNWMSKGVLGERLWLRRRENPRLHHHVPIIRVLTLATTTGTVLLVAGLVMLNLTLTGTGLVIAMLSKLWLLDRMVWVYEDNRSDTVYPHQQREDAEPVSKGFLD